MDDKLLKALIVWLLDDIAFDVDALDLLVGAMRTAKTNDEDARRAADIFIEMFDRHFES